MQQRSALLVSSLSNLDFMVFAGVLGATAAAVWWGHRLKGRTSEQGTFLDHLLMGRLLTLPMFTATLVATWYGGIFGVTEMAFKHGVFNFLTQGIFWYITYLLFAFFLVERIRKRHPVTLPELVSQEFGPAAARISAVFNLFNVVPVVYTISIGIFLQSILGVSFFAGCLLGTGAVCLYTLTGGFRSVVFSDLVQFFVMCLSVVLVVIFSYTTFGGMDYLRAQLPASHFDPTGGFPLSVLAVWGLIALSTLVDPNFYQRCFAAKSDRTAKVGIVWATAVWCVFDLCTTFGALYARASMPQLDPGSAYLTYAMTILPNGLRGFFAAGIVATILSTMDSYIFVGAHTISYDLLPQRYKQSIGWNRIAVVATGIMAILLAMSFEGSIKAAWKTLGSYSAGCLLVPMTLKLLFRTPISEGTFILSIVASAAGITYWRFASLTGFWQEVDELFVGIGLALIMIGMGTMRDRGHASLAD